MLDTNNGDIMRFVNKLWIIMFIIIVMWCYFIFISPKVFDSSIVVPDIVGLSEDEFIFKLKEEKIKYQITYIEDKENVVIKTIPYAGMSVKKDYVIEVFVGKILPKCYSSYMGMLYEDVELEIRNLCNEFDINLVIEYVNDNSKVSGVIIKESILDGEILNKGDTLVLSISTNDLYFNMPNLVGLNIYEALRILDEYKIKVIINYCS